MRMEQGYEKLLRPEASRDWREGGVGKVMEWNSISIKNIHFYDFSKTIIVLFKILIICV